MGEKKTKQKKNLSGEAGWLCTTKIKDSLLRGLVTTSFALFYRIVLFYISLRNENMTFIFE